ncbi:MAG TPA: type II toxin-antitoxin system RelE/ParE family toxin [Candidatus Nanoarchaeia archaeon]|nr:type II toxin-antitoxin system RelE/ParE family toxin [Candidatus Nanoarchaeia archaeon]
MSYKILPTKEFAKDFKKLDSQVQAQIKKKIDEVSINPTLYKKLQYDLHGSSRLRIGKLRVIFSYDESKQEVYLEKIVFGHRY